MQDLVNGKFWGGQNIEFGLAEGCVDISSTQDKHVPKDILIEVENIKKKIIAGEITIPINSEQYDNFNKID